MSASDILAQIRPNRSAYKCYWLEM